METDQTQSTLRANRLHAVLGGFAGTVIEWYDYFIYAAASALVFPKLYFGELGEAAGLVASLGTFGVAFLLRPVGAVIFGHFGDRLGRKKMLIVTLVLTAGGTFLIGCLPTTSTIGVAAPIMLIVLRLLQGVGLGGEWGGASLVVVEHAPTGRRGLFGSVIMIGTAGGQVLSSGAFVALGVLADEQFLSWGWRLPFWFSAVLFAVALYVRVRLEETPQFAKLVRERRQAKMPALEVLRVAKLRCILLVLVQAGSSVGYYTVTVFSLVYLTRELGVPRAWGLTGVLLAACVEMLTVPLFGYLSDRFGRRPVYGLGLGLFLVYAFPFFWLLDTRSEPLAWLAMILGLGLAHSASAALNPALYPEQFPTRMRYTGSSISYQLSSAVASAPAPVVAGWLLSETGSANAISVYMIVACVISLVCLALLKETAHSDISH